MQKLSEWQAFIRDLPALTTMELNKDSIITDYSHFSLVAVKGIDAQKFLQGQLTCDMQEINEQHYALACCCNVKGRMISSFLVFYHAAVFYLLMPRSLVDTVITHLKKYAIFSKVEWVDYRENYIGMVVAGTELIPLMSEQFPMLNEGTNFYASPEGSFILYQPNLPAWQLWVPIAQAQAVWQQWQAHSQVLSPTAWHLRELQAHHIHLYPQTVEQFTPHELSFQKLGGISFNKGCYMGQEIIARMQYLGKLKQRLYGLEVQTKAKLLPGDALYADQELKMLMGHVVDEQQIKANYFLLATLKDQYATQQLIYTKDSEVVEIMSN